MVSGTVAINMPEIEELSQRSPKAIAENGITYSATAKAHIAVLCAPMLLRAPRRQASGSNISIPSVMRPHATTNGESSCTASLMKK